MTLDAVCKLRQTENIAAPLSMRTKLEQRAVDILVPIINYGHKVLRGLKFTRVYALNKEKIHYLNRVCTNR